MNRTLIIPLTNGGTGGAIFVFLGTAIGMGFVIISLYFAKKKVTNATHRAPTSGGQYHWVSEFAPKEHQKFLSYVVGMSAPASRSMLNRIRIQVDFA
jgi:choline transport protein